LCEHSLAPDVYHVDYTHGFQDHRIYDFGEVIFDHQARVEHCSVHAHEASVHCYDPHYEAMRPLLGWVNLDCVKKTFENTIQWFCASVCLPFCHHFKSCFPAANVPCLHETVATDTFFLDVPAHDDGVLDGVLGHGGATMVLVYCGKDSRLTRGYPMTSEHDMYHTLEDFICQEGAPDALLSDDAKAQIGKNVQQILRMYCIADFLCEPHYQHQNYSERRIQELMKTDTALLDCAGTPAAFWLLTILYVIKLMNHLAVASLDWKTPLEVAHGQKPDFLPFLQFCWWEPVYYEAPATSGFPSDSVEKTGRRVGISEHQGDVLTYLVLTNDTLQVIACSNVCSALHDHATGRSAMGILHIVNQTPIEWFSKRQNTVETATYGSEFVVFWTTTEQIIDLCYTICMLGVPLDGPAWMFDDNESVVKSAMILHLSLIKQLNALAYHHVRKAIAAKVWHFLSYSWKSESCRCSYQVLALGHILAID
jgi:hypothetical protein